MIILLLRSIATQASNHSVRIAVALLISKINLLDFDIGK